MVLRRGPVKEPEQECPQCGRPVKMKQEGDTLLMYDLDGNRHQCFQPKPIGAEIKGKTIQGMIVKHNTLTLVLDDGYELQVFALGRVEHDGRGTSRRKQRLSLVMNTPDGALEE